MRGTTHKRESDPDPRLGPKLQQESRNYLRDIPMRHCLRRASSILWHGHHLRRAGMKIRPRIERATPLPHSVPHPLSLSLTGLTSAPSLDVRSQTKPCVYARYIVSSRASGNKGVSFRQNGQMGPINKKGGRQASQGGTHCIPQAQPSWNVTPGPPVGPRAGPALLPAAWPGAVCFFYALLSSSPHLAGPPTGSPAVCCPARSATLSSAYERVKRARARSHAHTHVDT